MHARYMPSGHLVFLRRGTRVAGPFDLNRLGFRGSPSPVLGGGTYVSANGDAFFDFSKTGTLVYGTRGGTPPRGGQVVVEWLDALGEMQPLLMTPGKYSRPRLSPDGRRLTVRATGASGMDIWVYDSERGTMMRLTHGGASPDSPVWSPDGRFIVFEDVQTGGMFWTRSNGGSKPQPLTRSNIVQRP